MYDGPERRREPREFCNAHIPMSNDIASIKTSLQNIEKATTQGITFKTAIVGSIIGVVILVIIQLITFSYLYGKLVNQVGVNTLKLENLERLEKLNVRNLV